MSVCYVMAIWGRGDMLNHSSTRTTCQSWCQSPAVYVVSLPRVRERERGIETSERIQATQISRRKIEERRKGSERITGICL